MSWSGNDPAENRRLDSWKEIAAFFGRDERTVKRWEKSRFLPVHRIPGSKRGGVFAYTRELTAWLNTPRHDLGSLEQVTENPEPIASLEQQASPEQQINKPARRSAAWFAWPFAIAAAALFVAFMIRSASLRIHGVESHSVVSQTLVRHVRNVEAEEHYLRGRYDWNRRTPDSLNHALDEFTQAIVHDPSDAKAYAGLADTYDLMREYTSMPASEAYPRAIAAANKAVTLDDSLSEAHRALAFGLFNWKWDVPNALQEYHKAIELNPQDVEAHHWYATTLLNLGSIQESLAEIERARRLDPASPAILADRGLILFAAGDHATGIAALRELEQTEPQFLSPPRYLARLFLAQADYPNFLAQSERAAAISKDPEEIAVARAARRGWSAGGEHPMLENMQHAQQTAFEKGQSSGFQLAYTCLLLGRKKCATQYLEAAYTARDPNLFTVNQGPFEKNLQGDPDFEQLKLKLQALRH